MPAVAFLNQKGGVGKTSSVHHLAGTLAKSGRSVLAIDNDPQRSLTNGFYGPEATERLPPSETIRAVYAGERPLPESVVRRTGFEGIDLLPGSASLTRYNVPQPRRRDVDEQFRLREFVDQVRSKYSLILIDCAPNLHLCSWAALLASDGVVIPVQAEDYGAQGVPTVIEAIDQAREVNPGLTLLGVLITMFDRRTSLGRLYESNLREMFGDVVFKTTIPRTVEYPEAINQRKPVSHYRPKGVAAERMRETAAELVNRVYKIQPIRTPRKKAVTS